MRDGWTGGNGSSTPRGDSGARRGRPTPRVVIGADAREALARHGVDHLDPDVAVAAPLDVVRIATRRGHEIALRPSEAEITREHDPRRSVARGADERARDVRERLEHLAARLDTDREPARALRRDRGREIVRRRREHEPPRA